MVNRNPNEHSRIIKNRGVIQSYFLPLSIFLFVFTYFFFVANPLLFFQEQRTLFVYDSRFLNSFFLKPGGILELMGKFITQFYNYRLLGSIIIAVVIACVVLLTNGILRKLNSNQGFSGVYSLLLACLLLLLQSHYYHYMEFNLGFLFALGYFWLSISKNNKSVYWALAFSPLFYYVAGGYTLIFAAMLILQILLNYSLSKRVLLPLILSAEIIICIIIFKEILFLQPLDQLLFFPFPVIDNLAHKTVLYILILLIVFQPALLKVPISFQNRIPKRKTIALFISLVIYAGTAFFLFKFQNPQTTRVLQIEKYALEEEWGKLIYFHEKYPSQNLIGQYFYNVALSETGQLCDHYFFGEQNFGSNSLILPWGNEYLSWGGYFYYSLGLINEAHRWAYEGMVVDGLRPQTLKMLVKTNLINGNLEMAQKYVNILKRTMNYRSWAVKYEELILGNALITDFPELEDKRSIMPKEDFFIQITSPQNNIPLLLNSNSKNKQAFEYEMIWLLLNKDVEAVANNLYRMTELGYTKIPSHLEEAALMMYNGKGKMPDLGNLTISIETKNNFNSYVSLYKELKKNSPSTKETVKRRFEHTYMFYFHFK